LDDYFFPSPLAKCYPPISWGDPSTEAINYRQSTAWLFFIQAGLPEGHVLRSGKDIYVDWEGQDTNSVWRNFGSQSRAIHYVPQFVPQLNFGQ